MPVACDALGRTPGKVGNRVELVVRRQRERDPAELVFMRKVISLFIFSAERNDQTEQEERREIKQRLTRKVRSDPSFPPVSMKCFTCAS